MSVLDKVDEAKQLTDRYPFLSAPKLGEIPHAHTLVVWQVGEFKSLKYGGAAFIDFVVVNTTGNHQPDTIATNAYMVNKCMFAGDTQEIDRLVDTVCKATGLPQTKEGLQSGKDTVKYLFHADSVKEQALRGVMVKCTTSTRQQKNKDKTWKFNTDGTPAVYAERVFETIPGQTPEQVKAIRAKLETTFKEREERKQEPKAEPVTPKAPTGGLLAGIVK